MPRGDRTGRFGFGPMTGRGMGYCAGYNHPGYAAFGGGFGRGRGGGFGYGFGGGGRGFGYGWNGGFAYPPVDEKKALSDQASFLEEELKAVKERLAELEKERN
jgi:hypothetical protein